MDVKLTRIETKIYALMKDGKRHTWEQIRDHAFDSLTELSAVKMKISDLRKKLERKGLFIYSSRDGGRLYYRITRLLTSGE